jgi:hypothetical protein
MGDDMFNQWMNGDVIKMKLYRDSFDHNLNNDIRFIINLEILKIALSEKCNTDFSNEDMYEIIVANRKHPNPHHRVLIELI